MNDDNKAPVLVLGIGNILLKDEGIGVKIINELEKISLPDTVDLIDGGTLGYELIPHIENRKHIIVVDAINAGGEPGTIYKFDSKEIKEKKEYNKFSLHQSSFYDVLRMSEFMNVNISDITIIAVQIKDITMGTELTTDIEQKIPHIKKIVIDEINKQLTS